MAQFCIEHNIIVVSLTFFDWLLNINNNIISPSLVTSRVHVDLNQTLHVYFKLFNKFYFFTEENIVVYTYEVKWEVCKKLLLLWNCWLSSLSNNSNRKSQSIFGAIILNVDCSYLTH